MTKPYYLALILSLGLAACAAEFTDSSDSNHITFLNSNDSSMIELTKKAQAYCQQYGKVASYRNSDTAFVAVFDCKLPH
jgi:putative hemolysin